jgi:hypothetical protein
MARIKHGILGGFSGVVGNVEGYVRNGIAYIRPKRRKTKKKPTIKILAARQRVSVVNKVVNAMTSFVALGFEGIAAGQAFSANNAAKSYQLLHALEGEYPDLTINYSKMLLSRGKLQPAELAAIELLDNGLKFSWHCEAISEHFYNQSIAMLLVYCPELNKSFYDLSGVKRLAREQYVELPADFIGKELHCYLSFVTDDRKMISDSMYVQPLVGG